MEKPIRIQRKRTKGFDMQAESMARNGLSCVYVRRPTRWGNPLKLGDKVKHSHVPIYETVTDVLEGFRVYADYRKDEEHGWLDKLRGKNLACFCKEGAPCHADILLELLTPAPQ